MVLHYVVQSISSKVTVRSAHTLNTIQHNRLYSIVHVFEQAKQASDRVKAGIMFSPVKARSRGGNYTFGILEGRIPNSRQNACFGHVPHMSIPMAA